MAINWAWFLGLANLLKGVVKWLIKSLHWIIKSILGVIPLEKNIVEIKNNLTGISQNIQGLRELSALLIAELSVSAKWNAEKIEKAIKLFGNFSPIFQGIDTIKPTGNPFTQTDIDKLKSYVIKAQNNQTFSSEEAKEFKTLSERVVYEYPNQDWVSELLKIALFIFAIYVIAKLLKESN